MHNFFNPLSDNVMHAQNNAEVACSGCSASYWKIHRWDVRINVDEKPTFLKEASHLKC